MRAESPRNPVRFTKRKNGNWQAEYHLGYDPNGKRIRKFVYGKTQREVREKLDHVKRQHADGNLASPDVTLVAYLREWLMAKARNVKPRTTELYTHYIENHTIPRIGRVTLGKFTPVHAQRLIGTIADEVGANTANKVRSLLRSAFKQAIRLQLVNRNPFDAVDPVKESPREMRIWSLEEAVRFLDTARSHRLYAAVLPIALNRSQAR